jgi:hypothetical protein
MKFLLIGVLFFLISCGESPLFNHRLENNNLIQDTFRSESDVQKFEKSGYSFVLSWVEGPQMGGSRFILKTWKNGLGTASGPYQDLPKVLNVFLWMPTMGHGSAPVKIRKLTNGEYEVSDVQFIMAGKWEIKFQLKDGLQVVDEVIIPVSL